MTVVGNTQQKLLKYLEKSSWCLPWAFNPLWYLKVLCMLPREKGKHQPSYNVFDPQWWPACKMCQSNSGSNLVGVTNQCLIGLKTHSMSLKAHLQHDWVGKRGQKGQGPKGKTKYIVLLTKWLPMTFCYTNRSVLTRISLEKHSIAVDGNKVKRSTAW